MDSGGSRPWGVHGRFTQWSPAATRSSSLQGKPRAQRSSHVRSSVVTRRPWTVVTCAGSSRRRWSTRPGRRIRRLPRGRVRWTGAAASRGSPASSGGRHGRDGVGMPCRWAAVSCESTAVGRRRSTAARRSRSWPWEGSARPTSAQEPGSQAVWRYSPWPTRRRPARRDRSGCRPASVRSAAVRTGGRRAGRGAAVLGMAPAKCARARCGWTAPPSVEDERATVACAGPAFRGPSAPRAMGAIPGAVLKERRRVSPPKHGPWRGAPAQLACSAAFSSTVRPPRGRASTAPVAELRRNSRFGTPESSTAFTVRESSPGRTTVTRVPAVT